MQILNNTQLPQKSSGKLGQGQSLHLTKQFFLPSGTNLLNISPTNLLLSLSYNL